MTLNMTHQERKKKKGELVKLRTHFGVTVVSEGGRGGYLLAGWWKFIRLSRQIGQIFQNGLQVGHLTKHVDLMVLHQHTHTHVNDECG